MRIKFLAVIIGVGALDASSASASVTFYTDQAAFDDAAGNLTTFDFSGVVSATGSMSYSTASGFTRDGVNFVGTTGSGGYSLGLQGPDFYGSDYDRGTNQASLQGPALTSSYYGITNGATTITLPTGGSTAVGLTVFDVLTGDSSGAGTDTVHLNVGQSSGSVVTPQHTGTAFLGVVSSTPLTSLTLTGTTNEEFPTFTTVSFASAASTTITTTGGDINASTYSLGSAAAKASPVVFDGGTLRMTGGSFPNNVITAPVTIDTSNGTVDTSTGNGGFSGVVSGPGALTVTGGGSFSLSNANTYAGGTVLSGGTLVVSTGTALSNGTPVSSSIGTGTLTLAGGSFQVQKSAALQFANAIQLGSAGGTIDSNQGGVVLAGAISDAQGGAGPLLFVNTGAAQASTTLDQTDSTVLAATNTYTGGSIIRSAAAVIDGASNGLGTGELEVDAGGILELHGVSQTVSALTGAGIIFAPGVAAGSTTISTLTVANGSFGGTLFSGVSFNSQNGSTTAGDIALVKVSDGTASGGTLTLSGASTFGANGGGVQLEGGTIALGNNAGLGAGALTFSASTTLQAAAGLLNIPNALVLAGSATIDTQADTLNAGGLVSGQGALTKIGSGTLGLSAPNAYAGGTVLTAGTIAVGDSVALGTGTLTFNGGTLQAGLDGLQIANAAVLATSGTIDTQAYGLSYNGAISGTGQLIKIGAGTLALTGSNTFSGGIALNGGTLAIANAAGLGTGTLTVQDGVLQAGANDLSITNAAMLAGNGTIDTQSFGLTYAGTVSGAGQLTKVGSGTLALTGANSFAGGTVLNGGAVAVGDSAALGTGTVTFGGGALEAAANGLSLANAAVLASNGTIDTQAFGLTYAGNLSGAGQLAKVGSGTLALTGANTFSGGTALTAGTIAVGSSTALGTGTLTFAGGALQAGADGLTLGNAAVLASGGTVDTQAFGLTFAGTISGASQLTKIGSGTLALTGTNTYSGGTALTAGAIAVGSAAALGMGTLTFGGGALQAGADRLSISNAAVLAANGTIDTQAFGLTYSGAIAGAGQLTKIGSGTLALTGGNTYSGGTVLNAGAIAVGSSAALGAGVLTFNGGALQAAADGLTLSNAMVLAGNATVDTQAFGLTDTGAISGAGQLTKIGTGSLTLAGAGTYSGGTVLAAGTLAVGASAALGTGALTFSGGTLQAAADGLTLTNAMTLAATGTIDTQAFGLTATGTLAGPGSLTKTGTGTLTLAGPNTFAGGTTLSAGTIAIGDDASLGTGGVTLDGGTLQAAQGAVLSVSNAVQVSTAGGIVDQNQGGLTLSGTVAGPGSLTFVNTGGTPIRTNINASNSIDLTAANTYSGGSIVRTAASVIVSANNALGSGSLEVDQNGSVDLDGVNQAVSTLKGSGVIFATGGSNPVGSVTLSTLTVQNGTFSGDLDYGYTTNSGGTNYGDLTLQKVSDGTASGGTLTLLGPSYYGQYVGRTLLQAGTIAVGDDAALGRSTLVMSNGTTLQLAADGLTLANAITLAGTDTFDTQDYASGLGLTGVISGPGTLVKIGSTGLGLDSANTYSGGTMLKSGRITLRNNAGLGTGPLTFAGGLLRAGIDGLTVSNAATLASNGTIDTQAFGLTYAGAIDGSGALTKAGSGTLTLTGENSYAGGTNVAAGTLQVGAGGTTGSISGNVTDNGTLTFDRSDSTTFGGDISGSGSVAQTGSGTLTLTGDNTYTGGTALNAGTLVVGSGTALGTGALTLAGGTLRAGADGLTLIQAATLAGNATIDTQAYTFTDAETIAGPGALTKTGTGTLALTGSNSFGGGTALAAGTLAVGSNTALGTGTLSMDEGTTLLFTANNLTLANAIVFTGAADPTIDTGSGNETISGPISGPGALTKLGSGTLDLTGTNTYTGPTAVAAGTLLVDGSTANSAVTVDGGAALGGTGSIGALVTQNGATIVPGAGRTLTVLGNVTFASGSTYQVTINGDGSSSALAVGGRATLNGATLAVLAGAGTFDASHTYTLLTAPGGVAGTFATVNASALALLTPTVSYTADSVDLNLQRKDFATVAATGNQAASARSIQALGPTSPLYNAILTLTTAGAQQAFAATSGVSQATNRTVVRTTSLITTGLINDRLWDVGGSGLSARQVLEQFGTDQLPAMVRCYGPVPDPVPVAAPASYTAWGEAFGSFGHTDGGANAGSLDRSLGGFVVGVDTPLNGALDAWRAGAAAGYTDTTFESHLDGGSGTVQGVFGSLYGGARYGAVDIRIGTTVTGTATDAVRRVAFPGFLESEQSSFGGLAAQGFGEIGYRFAFARAVLEPVVGAAILHVHQDGFDEKGGAAALIGMPQDNDLGTTTLGVRGEAAPFNGVPMIAHAFLGWQHTIGAISPLSTLAFEANASNTFTVSGAPIDRDALAASLALDYRRTAALDIGLSYTGLVGAISTEHAVKGRVEYRF